MFQEKVLWFCTLSYRVGARDLETSASVKERFSHVPTELDASSCWQCLRRQAPQASLHHWGRSTENNVSVGPVLLYLADPNTVPGTWWAFQILCQVNRYVSKTNGGWEGKSKKWKEECLSRYDLPVANKLLWQNINSERPQRKTSVGPSQVTVSVLNLSSKSISSFMNRGRRKKAALSRMSLPRRI